jgi:DNA-3-methyladenine glycosylase
MPYLGPDFFMRDTISVARDLIGVTLVVGECEGRIVETEAYTTDPASHAVTRPRQAAAMRDTFGHVYVYLIYGMHYCLNFTTDIEGVGAVLIRAVEPVRGIEIMKRRRKTNELRRLTRGPGRLCAAFGIDLSFNGKPVGESLLLRARKESPEIESSQRIGITQGLDLEWRFYQQGSPFVSGSRKRSA